MKQTGIVTPYPLISMMITYDSTRAIAVTKKDDREYAILMYDLETNACTFQEKVGGGSTAYIKVKEVEQNSDGKKFALTYFDDGVFYLRVFGKKERTEQEVKENDVELNSLLGLDNYTMCNADFPDPYVTCCFVTDTRIFVALFYNYTLTHYHFIWDLE